MVDKTGLILMTALLSLALVFSVPAVAEAADNGPGIAKKTRQMKHKPGKAHKAPVKSKLRLTHKSAKSVPSKPGEKPFASPADAPIEMLKPTAKGAGKTHSPTQEAPLKPGGNPVNQIWSTQGADMVHSGGEQAAPRKSGGNPAYIGETEKNLKSAASASSSGKKGAAVYVEEIPGGARTGKKGVDPRQTGQVDLGHLVSK